MNLPHEENLPIHLLSRSFKNTSATYKYYWFLAILNRVELGEVKIAKQALFAEMLAHAWYTVNYFKVSFGKQDKLQDAIFRVKEQETLPIDADRRKIYERLVSSSDVITRRALNYFNSEVPHRFLSPWFPGMQSSSVYAASQQFDKECLYALHKDHVQINPRWITYLHKHGLILRHFCYWNLATYLQTRNPNVPDIPNKLIKQPQRKPLFEQRKFWDIVLKELGSVDCIYTGKRLVVGGYAVEHFLPYAFVSHDLIWNLIPADHSFNSKKSDQLPSLHQYFEPFFRLQESAVQIVSKQAPKNNRLQDYLTILPGLEANYFTPQRFREQIEPLVTIARNNGFREMITF